MLNSIFSTPMTCIRNNLWEPPLILANQRMFHNILNESSEINIDQKHKHIVMRIVSRFMVLHI